VAIFITSHVPVSQLREKKGSGSQTGVKVPALTIIDQHHHRHHIIGIQFKVEIKNLINTGLNGLQIENKSIIKRRRMRDNELCFVCLLLFFFFFLAFDGRHWSDQVGSINFYSL
jgi:hypothetical protein